MSRKKAVQGRDFTKNIAIMIEENSINEKMLCNRRYVGILSADERMQFAKRVCEGAKLDPTEALHLLIKEYMDNCGISLGIGRQ